MLNKNNEIMTPLLPPLWPLICNTQFLTACPDFLPKSTSVAQKKQDLKTSQTLKPEGRRLTSELTQTQHLKLF